MRKTLIKYLLAANAVLLIALAALLLWRSGELPRAKKNAWKSLASLTAEQRATLNAVPVPLPMSEPANQPLHPFTLARYQFHVPPPASQTPDSDGRDVTLTYPAFRVRIRKPRADCECDAIARKAGFADSFEFMSLLYHARLDDIDSQPDVPSLNGHMLLLEAKSEFLAARPQYQIASYAAEFKHGNFRGVLFASNPQKSQFAAEVQGPAGYCTMSFTADESPALPAIHQFLTALQFDKQK